MVSRSTTFFKLPRCIKAPVTACIVVYVPLEAWDVFSAEKSFYSFLKVTLENSWNFKLVCTKLLIILNVILRSRDKLERKAMTLMDSCICSNKSLSSSCRTPPPPPPSHDGLLYFYFTALWTQSPGVQVAGTPHPSMSCCWGVREVLFHVERADHASWSRTQTLSLWYTLGSLIQSSVQ